MNYTEKPPKTEAQARTETKLRHASAWLLAAMLAGCSGQSGPMATYHHIMGGPGSGNPPPAPGLAEPFPNLASVPVKPQALPQQEQREIRARLQAENLAARSALAPKAAPATAPASPPSSPPVLVGFSRNSAIISRSERGLLRGMPASRNGASAILAAGFAPTQDAAGLRLALYRALAIADALTNAGVPPQDVRLAALASGHGGFAQWLYNGVPQPAPASKPASKPDNASLRNTK